MTKKLTAFVSTAALGVFLATPVLAQETSQPNPGSSNVYSPSQPGEADLPGSSTQPEPTPPSQPQPQYTNQSSEWSSAADPANRATNNRDVMRQTEPTQSNWTSSRVYMLRYDANGREFICVCGQRVYFDDSPAPTPTQARPEANQLAPDSPEPAESMNEAEEVMEEDSPQGAIAPVDPADPADETDAAESVDTATDDTLSETTLSETQAEPVTEEATDQRDTVVDEADDRVEDAVETDSLPPLE